MRRTVIIVGDLCEFSMSLESGRAFTDQEEAALHLQNISFEVVQSKFVEAGGGAKRTREDREQSLTKAMSDIAPSNPFAATLQNFYNEVATNNPNNILESFIGNLGRCQCQVLSEEWYNCRQTDPSPCC